MLEYGNSGQELALQDRNFCLFRFFKYSRKCSKNIQIFIFSGLLGDDPLKVKTISGHCIVKGQCGDFQAPTYFIPSVSCLLSFYRTKRLEKITFFADSKLTNWDSAEPVFQYELLCILVTNVLALDNKSLPISVLFLNIISVKIQAIN